MARRTITIFAEEMEPVSGNESTLTYSSGDAYWEVAGTGSAGQDVIVLASVKAGEYGLRGGFYVHGVRVGGTGAGTNGIATNVVNFYEVSNDGDGTATPTAISHSVTESTGAGDFEDNFDAAFQPPRYIDEGHALRIYVSLTTGTALSDIARLRYIEVEVED